MDLIWRIWSWIWYHQVKELLNAEEKTDSEEKWRRNKANYRLFCFGYNPLFWIPLFWILILIFGIINWLFSIYMIDFATISSRSNHTPAKVSHFHLLTSTLTQNCCLNLPKGRNIIQLFILTLNTYFYEKKIGICLILSDLLNFQKLLLLHFVRFPLLFTPLCFPGSTRAHLRPHMPYSLHTLLTRSHHLRFSLGFQITIIKYTRWYGRNFQLIHCYDIVWFALWRNAYRGRCCGW